MTTVNDISNYLKKLAPPELAEDWDNVGLLVGDETAHVGRVMTCLTVTPESAAEAIENQVDLIITHHPLPFRPLTRLTTEQTAGRLLLELIKANIAIYSPHTAFDSTIQGINQMLAEAFGATGTRPLVPCQLDDPAMGAARIGSVGKSTKLADLIETAKTKFKLSTIGYVGDRQQLVSQICFACGSGGTFLDAAIEAGCDAFVTGETSFHTCLEASASGVGVLLLGHYASERFALERLADKLQQTFDLTAVWASRRECDPINFA